MAEVFGGAYVVVVGALLHVEVGTVPYFFNRGVSAEFVAVPGGEQEVAGEGAEAGGEVGFVGFGP